MGLHAFLASLESPLGAPDVAMWNQSRGPPARPGLLLITAHCHGCNVYGINAGVKSMSLGHKEAARNPPCHRRCGTTAGHATCGSPESE